MKTNQIIIWQFSFIIEKRSLLELKGEKITKLFAEFWKKEKQELKNASTDQKHQEVCINSLIPGAHHKNA